MENDRLDNDRFQNMIFIFTDNTLGIYRYEAVHRKSWFSRTNDEKIPMAFIGHHSAIGNISKSTLETQLSNKVWHS